MPSLDAASVLALQRVNRPHDSIKLETYIGGLETFSAEFKGKLALEIFILPGCNDSLEERVALKAAVARIKPDVIQLNTLDRPGVISGIHSATREELEAVAEFLKPFEVEIIAAAPARKGLGSYRDDMESAILETVLRRPCTLEDLTAILGSHVNEINKYLGSLEEAGKIEHVRQERGLFYQAKNKFSKN
jgi:wyosine [tRNA(Phe)-imidazoG37] synthetase (radical SAM superfamily)